LAKEISCAIIVERTAWRQVRSGDDFVLEKDDPVERAGVGICLLVAQGLEMRTQITVKSAKLLKSAQSVALNLYLI
jgi:hypothetical protein